MIKKPFKVKNFLFPVITGAALGLLIGGAVYSSISSTITSIQENSGVPGEDMISSWEKRVRKSRLLLPNSGIVGYVADWDLPDKQFGPKDQQVEFLLTQYTLAPLVLVRGTDHEIIIGNFNDTGDPGRINNVTSILGIELTTAFSNEFYIFKGPGR